MYNKRIILDFDDTLAFPKNRDWQAAEPNTRLIEKTNTLYDEGWTVDVFTARGSISCDTRKQAEEKYGDQIKQWLENHNVKYHSLSFDKPLALYYIDDKGITPEEFITTDIRQLEGGLSGSDIYTDGTWVHKNDKNAHKVNEWYTQAKNYVNTPEVLRLVGETLTIEYIEHDKSFFKNNFHRAIGIVQESLEEMREIDTPEDSFTFADYVARIYSHSDISGEPYFSTVCGALKQLDFKRSFSHGDFGVTNLLFKGDRLYLIDPIPDVFGCTEIDAAKFCASLMVNQYDKDIVDNTISTMSVFNSINQTDFRILIAAELIRVFKYHPKNKIISEAVKSICVL